MPDSIFQYVLLGCLAIALLIAAATDLRSRTISNALNAAVAAGAPLFWWASGLSLWPGVAIQLAVALAAFVVCAGFFALRQMGGGDVKLLTATALWIDPLNFMRLLVVMAIAGGLISAAMLIARRFREAKAPAQVPYGVAIAAGGLWVLSRHYAPALAGNSGLAG